MNIIIFGLPGAGKGTQAKMIARNQNIPHISTGDLLRNAYQEKSVLGLLAIFPLKKINHVIYIHVEETILQERLTGRRVCSKCGASFHIIYKPSKFNNQCDFCHEPLMQREDDKEETVIERLIVNKELTNNLAEYYKKKGVLRVINGSQEIMKVTEEILNLLGRESD